MCTSGLTRGKYDNNDNIYLYRMFFFFFFYYFILGHPVFVNNDATLEIKLAAAVTSDVEKLVTKRIRISELNNILLHNKLYA